MTTTSPVFNKTIAAIFLSSALLVGTAKAQIASHSKDIVIEQPTNLPELAQEPGIAFQLYTESGDGSAYLYIEQQNGARLVALDVTDPARVKIVRTVSLSVPGPFDFVQPLNDSAILVRFRNNMGEAALDLRKAKAPALRPLSGLQHFGHTEPLGDSAFLMVDEARVEGQPAPRDYQVVDTSNPANPTLLYTAKLVGSIITRNETGTTFLLGLDGLTIIRQPRVEERYQEEQSYTN
jgi:hypothetical protein